MKYTVKTHTGTKDEKCSYCLLKFGDPASLRRHIKRFHNESTICNPFVCRICRKPFKEKKDLKKHLMSHLQRQEIQKNAELWSRSGIGVIRNFRRVLPKSNDELNKNKISLNLLKAV